MNIESDANNIKEIELFSKVVNTFETFVCKTFFS